MMRTDSQLLQKLLLFLAACIYAIILLRTLWISDDAAITLRSVMQFTHGQGLVFNLGERVQAYTHPLWFFLLSFGYVLVGNIFYATFLVSFLTSSAAVYLFIRTMTIGYSQAIALLFILPFSQAFIDYSGSGLETPLVYLLSVLFVIWFMQAEQQNFAKSCFKLWLGVSLLYLTRPDAILIVLPALGYAVFQQVRTTKSITQAIFQALGGLAPAIVWTGFSIIYYGFPFPNTAYAKLGTGIPKLELMAQGVYYIFDSLKYDPFTITIIALAICYSIFSAHRLSRLLSIGIALYFLYILRIGGDFMSGRFFAYPFFIAFMLLATLHFNRLRHQVLFYATLAAIGGISITVNNQSFMRDADLQILPMQSLVEFIRSTGIADERKFYYFGNKGLLHATRNTFTENFDYQLDKPVDLNNLSDRTIKTVCGGLGFFSLNSGAVPYWIDACALANPLLSRVPAIYDPNWRIGHFARSVPEGYEDSIRYNKNMIKDPCLHDLYDKIILITQAPLFSTERFNAIAELNFNPPKCDSQSALSNIDATLASLSERKQNGHPWNQKTILIPAKQRLTVSLGEAVWVDNFDFSFDHNDQYQVFLYNKNELQWSSVIEVDGVSPGLVSQLVKLKKAVLADKLVIEPKSGDQLYSVGHLIINDKK